MVATTRIAALTGADAELLAAARLRAARDQPYLAAALFAMVPVNEPGNGTFAVDRWWRLYLDMDQARLWGVAGTAAVLIHEAHHLVRNHHDRARRLGVTARQHRRWNLAADAAINDDLVADGVPLPDPILPHHLGCAAGGFEEAYYRSLRDPGEHLEQAPPPPADASAPTARLPAPGAPTPRQATPRQGTPGQDPDQKDPPGTPGRRPVDPGCGSGAGGTPHPHEIPDEPTDPASGLDTVAADAVRSTVAHDVAAAEAAGEHVPPSLLRWAMAFLEPQVPWPTLLRAALRKDLRAAVRNTTPDWSRPDRRADSSPGVLRPGHRHVRPRVAVVVDTSASMEPTLLDVAVTEIDALLHRGGASPIDVLVCDQEAAHPQRVRRLGDLSLSGGRGTDMRIGIAAAAALRPPPRVIVVLTDGETPWPTCSPAGIPVVVVMIDASGRDPQPAPTGAGFRTVRVTSR